MSDESFARSCFTLDEHRGQAFERAGRAREQPRQLVPHRRQRRARPEQLMQHVLILGYL